MAGPGTTITGPLISGPKFMADGGTPVNTGVAQLFQSATITQNGTNAVSATMTLPPNSTIIDIIMDNTTVWNSATSAVLTVGTVAAGTTYVTSVNVKAAAGRTVVAGASPTGPQLLAMQNIGTNTSVVATVTPVGATSAGTTTVTLEYVQNVENIDSQF